MDNDDIRYQLQGIHTDLAGIIDQAQDAFQSISELIPYFNKPGDELPVTLREKDWQLVVTCLDTCHTILDKYGWDVPGLSTVNKTSIGFVLRAITEQLEESHAT